MWFSMVIIVKIHQSIILRPIIYELVMQIFKKKNRLSSSLSFRDFNSELSLLVGRVPGLGDTRYGQRVNAVGVSVAVTRVRVMTTVARRPHIY